MLPVLGDEGLRLLTKFAVWLTTVLRVQSNLARVAVLCIFFSELRRHFMAIRAPENALSPHSRTADNSDF